MRLLTGTLDDRHIGYSEHTEFYVQLGFGKGGRWMNKYTFRGNLGQAVLYYNALNIGRGYKKRLFMPSCEKEPVLALARS